MKLKLGSLGLGLRAVALAQPGPARLSWILISSMECKHEGEPKAINGPSWAPRPKILIRVQITVTVKSNIS